MRPESRRERTPGATPGVRQQVAWVGDGYDHCTDHSPHVIDLEHLLEAACRLDAAIDLMTAGELYPEWSLNDPDIRIGCLRILLWARRDLQAAGV